MTYKANPESLVFRDFQSQICTTPGTEPLYWGYNTVNFFAPHYDYSSNKDPLGPLDEFRDLVKALHRAGIEVILDVVFNHSAEGNEYGPTLSYRGAYSRVVGGLLTPDLHSVIPIPISGFKVVSVMPV